jgi:hypothetical protein
MAFPSRPEIELWLKAHEAALWWVMAGSTGVTVGTLIALPWVVALIPNDYFATKDPPKIRGRSQHPVLRWMLRIGKNLLGIILVILGLVMSLPLVPGQGLITALAGLLLLNFPGKRRFEMWLVRRHGVLRGINWLRARRGRPPLIVWCPEPKGLPAPVAGPGLHPREPVPR